MGSVTDLTVSGDNDEPIFPIEYYRHYMYCDVCGSFELKHWKDWEEDFQSTHRESVLTRLFKRLTALKKSKPELRGVFCKQCETTYAYGSPFFVDFKENPRNFTMDDVPRPLYNVYQIKGDTIGPA